MEAICGAKCSECELFKNKKCEGCRKTNGCPFGKKCWIAKYIEVGGLDSFNEFKKGIIDEINSINVDGLPKIEELYILSGRFVNLEYPLPNRTKTKLLKDDEAYLGTQIESKYNTNEEKYYGIVANMNFILICEYDKEIINPEILIYKKR